jgi:ribosomal protein S10
MVKVAMRSTEKKNLDDIVSAPSWIHFTTKTDKFFGSDARARVLGEHRLSTPSQRWAVVRRGHDGSYHLWENTANPLT